MSRIRTIKPDFFFHESIAQLSPECQLFFIGLWTQADREGRLEDRPIMLRAAIFPYHPERDVEEMLCELAAYGHIIRYKAARKAYIQIHNFTEHQRPHKELPSRLPAPPPMPKKPARKIPGNSGKFRGGMKTSSGNSGTEVEVEVEVEVEKEGKGLSPSASAIAEKPMTKVQQVVMAYKMVLGVDRDDKAWDRANFGRYSKSAKSLIECCGSVENACNAMAEIAANLTEAGLSFTLETITRHAFDNRRKYGSTSESLGPGPVNDVGGIAGPSRSGESVPQLAYGVQSVEPEATFEAHTLLAAEDGRAGEEDEA